ncbi:MAG: NADH:ubiquinone reductase (Na(+)-transporting) subunit E [Bacteroidales bacterium]|nr:NADH:ubiquinone reductase (Na(+)-transporting) subunit E [Bacteroidales bacterium]
MENFNLFIRSIFVDNMVFAYFLGMCSFLAVSKNVKTAFGLGVAVTFMLVVTLPINYLLNTYVLKAGALSWVGPEYADVDLSFLSLIMFIAVIASMTQLVEMVVEKYSPSLYASLGIFLPLIAVNCAILGGSLFMQQRDWDSVITPICAGGGWGLGWLMAITAVAAIRERLASYSNIPAPLRGIGITFIVTALMGIAFMSFLGIKI